MVGFCGCDNWHSAMVDEMHDIDDNGTWDLVFLPTEKKAIGCCWVFAVKFNPDGSVDRLKVRLVAKGYMLRLMELIILILFLLWLR